MRLLWFSPIPPAATDVANYTFRLAEHLHDLAEVTFVHPGRRTSDSDRSRFSTATLEMISAQTVNRADLCIYQIGNNPVFHKDILSFAVRNPGLVILHDRSLQDLLFTHGAPAATDASGSVDTYLQAMGHWYGQAGIDAAESVRHQDLRLADIGDRFPLFEAVLDRSLGVASHNRNLTAEIEDRFPKLPCLTLPLPYAIPRSRPVRPVRSDTSPIRLIMFGFMAQNRRATEFLEAWALSEHRDQFHLDLCGEMFMRSRFDARAVELGLSAQIAHHGFVSEVELDLMIQQADMALNLRHPTMGEASGSQLRIWANGCPSVVSSSGWYATLNERSVRKIGCDTERDDLLLLLRDLATRRIDCEGISIAGFEQLSRHSPLQYVQNLLTWIDTHRTTMIARWAEAALMESVARSYARSLPWNYAAELPPLLLRKIRSAR